MSDEILHFGRHKAKPLSEIPLHYLDWVILNIKDRRAVATCIKELDRRGSALPRGVKRPKLTRWQDIMAQTHYKWTTPAGATGWIPNCVDMTGRENEECPF